MTYHLWGWRTEPGEKDDEHFDVTRNVGGGGSWQQFSDTCSFNFSKKDKPDARHESGDGHFEFRFNGQGQIYLDDVVIKVDQP